MSNRLDWVIDGCDASIEAETEDAVLARAQEHAASAHPQLDLDDETVASIRASIRHV